MREFEETKTKRSKFESQISPSTALMKEDIQNIVSEQFPALQKKVEELDNEKQELTRKLDKEQQSAYALTEFQKYLRRETEELKGKMKVEQGEVAKRQATVDAITLQIEEKEEMLKELRERLESTSREHEQTKQHLADLMNELSDKMTELEKRSSKLRNVIEIQPPNDTACQARYESQLQDEELRLKLARDDSQAAYIAEIKVLTSNYPAELHEQVNQCGNGYIIVEIQIIMSNDFTYMQGQISSAEKEVEQKRSKCEQTRINISQLESYIQSLMEALELKQNELQKVEDGCHKNSTQNSEGAEARYQAEDRYY